MNIFSRQYCQDALQLNFCRLFRKRILWNLILAFSLKSCKPRRELDFFSKNFPCFIILFSKISFWNHHYEKYSHIASFSAQVYFFLYILLAPFNYSLCISESIALKYSSFYFPFAYLNTIIN